MGRHVQNIQNRSSTRAPQFSTSQSDWNETDLPNSPCTVVSCCLPVKISRVPHLRIQSCSLEINFAVVPTCLESKFHRLVYCCHFHWLLSPWISTFWCPCLYVEVWAVACTNNQRLCVHTFRKFDTHIRIASVLLSFLRRLCLSGFLFLSCHPSCPCFIFLCLSLSARRYRLPLNLHRVCYWLKLSWRWRLHLK